MTMASHVINSIDAALEVLREREIYRNVFRVDRMVAIMVHKLRGLRTFLLCSKLLRTEDNSDGELIHKLRVLRRRVLCSGHNSTPESLLERVEDVVSRILDTCSDPKTDFRFDLHEHIVSIESFEEEMDKWYAGLSDYLQQSSSAAVPDQVWWDIANSIIANLEDFLSIRRAYVGMLVEPVEVLKENITFLRNFIRFATLLCAEHQEFRVFLTLIQPVAISAAHLTLQLFSAAHYNAEVFFQDVTDSKRELCYEKMKSAISALLPTMKPGDNPHLCEAYAQLLRSIRNSRESYVPKLDLKVFIDFLLSTLWEMLQLDTAPMVSSKDKLQVLYEGLRFLTAVLEKQQNKVGGELRNVIAAAIFDAGLVIFSLHQKDSAIDHGLQGFLENIQLVRTALFDDQVAKASEINFPHNNVMGFLDSLSDCLIEARSIMVDSHILTIVQEDIVFLKSIMGKLVEMRNQQEHLHQAVWTLAVQVAYKMELLIDQLVLGNVLDSFSTSFQSIAEDMMVIKAGSMKIFDEITQETRVQKVTWTSTDQGPSQSRTPAADQVVGFETERSSIIDRLERGSKTLQVVAIVGMPGLGKTTLATKVYSDPSVTYHFHVRTWCSISHVFNRRKVLLELLNQIRPGENSTKNEDDLAHELRNSLLRRRYLVFLDDVWDIQAFDCLKEVFPDNNTGSRILLTSRQGDLVPEAMRDGKPLFLPHLTPEESLELLHRKLFPSHKDWPPALHEFGMEVADYCKGLPLTVVIVAGILTATLQEAWNETLGSLRSGIISALTDECVNSIEFSYKHLPDYLKSCFLSFGGYSEDQEVDVKRLIWSWTAEGFIQKSMSKSLEEVATDYLNILIERSLVMKARDRSRGGVKACRIHDLLHDFCLRKANEEHFLLVLKKEPLPFCELGRLRRLCVHSTAEHFKDSKLFFPHLRSLTFFHRTDSDKVLDMSFIFRIFKLLRVLAMDRVDLAHFPSEIGYLVRLRYLAMQVGEVVWPSIGRLTNLETLILYPKTRGPVKLSDTFWNLQKLRHLYLSSKYVCIELPLNNPDRCYNLLELESLCTLFCDSWDIMEKQLRKFPSIRRLKCTISDDLVNGSKLMSFSFLAQLESLSLSYIPTSCPALILPEHIKKLVLDVEVICWETFSTIAEMPNLLVLKLLHGSFAGDTWHVREGEFSKLKFLMLRSWGVVKWTAASDDQFSNLERLVLDGCSKLEEIPECLENAPALKMIEVRCCPDRIASLVKKVEDWQQDMGNSDLQVHVRDTFKEDFINEEGQEASDSGDVSGKEENTQRQIVHKCITRRWKRLIRG